MFGGGASNSWRLCLAGCGRAVIGALGALCTLAAAICSAAGLAGWLCQFVAGLVAGSLGLSGRLLGQPALGVPMLWPRCHRLLPAAGVLPAAGQAADVAGAVGWLARAPRLSWWPENQLDVLVASVAGSCSAVSLENQLGGAQMA